MKNIIILGSGRSGTSMISGALASSGYHLGENSEYLGKNRANPKGFFEDYEVNTINEDILKKSVINIPEKYRAKYFPSFTFYRARWLARIPNFIPVRSDNKIDSRIKKVLTKEIFCYKDPRFSYTLPIWLKYLNNNTCYIVIFREPEKTAQSIVRECKESKVLNKLKMKEKTALKVWKYMYRSILSIYNKHNSKENWLFMHYNQIFDEEKINSLEKLIGAKIDSSFAEKEISRSRVKNNISDKKINLLYEILNKLAD